MTLTKIQKPSNINDNISLSSEKEEIAQYYVSGMREDDIAESMELSIDYVSTMLKTDPLLRKRIKYLMRDKFDRWNDLTDSLYEEILVSLIKDAREGILTEKTRMELVKRLENRFGIFSETVETQTLKIPAGKNKQEVLDKIGTGKSLLFGDNNENEGDIVITKKTERKD